MTGRTTEAEQAQSDAVVCSECGHTRREHIFDDRCVGRMGPDDDDSCPCRRQPSAIVAYVSNSPGATS